jgi:hypothetical protein
LLYIGPHWQHICYKRIHHCESVHKCECDVYIDT